MKERKRERESGRGREEGRRKKEREELSVVLNITKLFEIFKSLNKHGELNSLLPSLSSVF